MTEITNHAMLYAKSVAKWLVVSIVTGLLGGVIGSLFHLGVAYATGARTELPQLLWALPFVGLFIVWFYRAMRTQGLGTNIVIDAVHQGELIPITLIPSIFLGTILTHLVGGSAGREGAALQIGGTLGEHIGRMFRLDDKDCRLATLCGMSALFSALFGTPLAATFFALEVISVGVLYYAGFIPCITAAIVAYGVSLRFGIAPTRFAIAVPVVDTALLARTALLAMACAWVSILFCEVLHRMEHLAERKLPNPYLRVFVGGCAVIVLTLLVGCRDYNGAGMDIVTAALNGYAKPEAFLLKIIFTAITLGCGFKGGEVVPTLFVGATFGCVAGGLIGMPPALGAALGITSLFCGVTNCPVASLILSIEMFGADGLLCYAVACAMSYVFSGYRGLYSHQKILYSKLRAEFIDVHTK